MNANSTVESVTNYTAAGAVTSPLWLPAVKTVSDFSGLLLPILGAVWLATQIVIKIREHVRKPPNEG